MSSSNAQSAAFLCIIFSVFRAAAAATVAMCMHRTRSLPPACSIRRVLSLPLTAAPGFAQVLRLSLQAEVKAGEAKARRSKTTGSLVVTMPKVDPDQVMVMAAWYTPCTGG